MPIENLIDKVENEKYAELKDDLETLVAQKIVDRINTAKEEIQNIAKGIEPEVEESGDEPVIPASEEVEEPVVDEPVETEETPVEEPAAE
jgi:hypothetical protein